MVLFNNTNLEYVTVPVSSFSYVVGRNEEKSMSTKSNVKKILLSFVVLTLTAALTYYADAPSSQSVAIVTDKVKI